MYLNKTTFWLMFSNLRFSPLQIFCRATKIKLNSLGKLLQLLFIIDYSYLLITLQKIPCFDLLKDSLYFSKMNKG